MPWGEIILAVLGFASAFLAYLRGGGAEARKQLQEAHSAIDELEADRDMWRTRYVVGQDHLHEIERNYVLLKRKHNETLSDSELRLLASTTGSLRSNSNGSGNGTL